MVNFWTVKIAGVSGTGKTTVMKGLQSRPGFTVDIVIYSQLLRECGDKDVADLKLADILNKAGGLVLMDDHLEFDNPNKRATTCGKIPGASYCSMSP